MLVEAEHDHAGSVLAFLARASSAFGARRCWPFGWVLGGVFAFRNKEGGGKPPFSIRGSRGLVVAAGLSPVGRGFGIGRSLKRCRLCAHAMRTIGNISYQRVAVKPYEAADVPSHAASKRRGALSTGRTRSEPRETACNNVVTDIGTCQGEKVRLKLLGVLSMVLIGLMLMPSMPRTVLWMRRGRPTAGCGYPLRGRAQFRRPSDRRL